MTNYSKVTTINLFMRSLLFAIFSLTIICLYSFVMVVSFLFPLRIRFVLIRAFLNFYLRGLKFICRIDYQIEGLENIPQHRAGVVLSKHQSTWETFCLPTLFNDPAVIAKRELLWIPFFGWGLAASNPITIDRSQKSSAMQQILSKGERFLAQGRWILLFPEGTRVPYGKVGNYKLGGARLAVLASCPVIPVAHNAGYFWPRRKFIKFPGTVKVVIGKLIETKGRTPEDVLAEAKGWIENTMGEIA